MYNSQVVVFDIETVNPKSNDLIKGSTIENAYDKYDARIWQIAFVCKDGDFERHVHPGFDLDKLSETSKEFVGQAGLQKLSSLSPKDGLADAWPSICTWLCAKSLSGKVTLVAQQARRCDEIVLAVEMVRHGLEWPKDLDISVVEALPCVQRVMRDYKGPWGVSAVYKELWGKKPAEPHRALCDARCLTDNLLMCWTIQHGIDSSRAHEMERSFWDAMQRLGGWRPQRLLDHRQSIWVLTTATKGLKWSREIAKQLEERADVHTIEDFLTRCADPRFVPKLCQDPVLSRYVRPICDAIDHYHIKSI